ncbi:lipid A biosynthesis acyltransferase [Undibacterium sp. Ji67W]|uniref:LpxL/LpxP family acyltransferase n=1 Tax=Undibacterium sp. Ji67W TaxID=3413042 RepID=UPI003BEF5AC2
MRLVLALMWLLHWLPLPVLGRLGEGVGSILFNLIPKRRHIALTNLRLCMPHLSEGEREKIARQHFQMYARSVFERGILWWGSEARLKRLIQIEPRVPLDVINAGPTILMCPHFVCLDVAGVAVMLESSLCSIYTEQRNKVFDRALRRGRSRFRPVKLFSRAEGVKPIIRAMTKDGLPYFMLPDMDFGVKNAEFIPFFGIPAATLTAMPRLAASTGAKIVPVIATMLPNYRGWKVTFHTPWDHYPGEDDMTTATRQMNAFIEQEILKAPSEYFWAHKRFKTRPEGEPSVY